MLVLAGEGADLTPLFDVAAPAATRSNLLGVAQVGLAEVGLVLPRGDRSPPLGPWLGGGNPRGRSPRGGSRGRGEVSGGPGKSLWDSLAGGQSVCHFSKLKFVQEVSRK